MRPLRSSQIEMAVRAAMRAGLSRVRVTVDYANGRIELEGDDETDSRIQPVRTFDTIDFRAGP